MRINFQSVEWKNFLSYGNAITKVDLNNGRNNLIVGSNGSGKSTLLDALCFGLFGKAYRKITKSKLINSINNRDTVVTVVFTRGVDTYKIVRSIKPDNFEIFLNDKKLDQLAKSLDQQKILEEQILGFTQKTFMQTVVLGSATYQPFMQLGKQARREVIEDLLDISILGNMADNIKAKIKKTQAFINERQHSLDLLLANKKSELALIKQIESMSNDMLNEMKERLKEKQDVLGKALLKQESLSKEFKIKSEVYKEYCLEKEKQIKIAAKIKSLNAEIEILSTNKCNVCGSELIDDSLLIDRQKKLALCKEHVSIVEEIDQPDKSTLIKVESIIYQLKQDIREMVDKIKSHKVQDIEPIEAKIKEIEKSELSINTAIDLSNDNLLHLHKISDILKDDGVKANIISSFIPKINHLVNSYLEAMNFNVSFILDDQFNEEIKSRHRDSFSYFSFSEGEKDRIDLALLFTWREIAKLRNSTDTNLIILDEIMDGSLDDQGLKDFSNMLYGLDDSTTSFIISHNPEFTSRFGNVFEVKKRDGFSHIHNVTDIS